MKYEDEETLLADVREIKRGLFGDTNFEQSGLVHEVTVLKAWKKNVQSKVAYFSGAIGVILWLVSMGFNAFWAWLTAFFENHHKT